MATLTLHQITIALLSAAGAVQASPYSLRPVPPFGLPQVASLAFWGGLWGCVWVLVAEAAPRRLPLWAAGIVFGALLPTGVAWFVVAPLKGQPMAAGWDLSRMWVAPLVNGLWGLGTAVSYRLLQRGMARSQGWG